MRVLAAMSGGVDSAVAAARAVEAGHEVTGVHLALSKNPQSFRTGARGCCTVEDSRDARRAADVIGIPFYIWDLAERFHADVVDDFVSEYAAGRTPNPCLRCNEKIKFSAVLDKALALGFDAVCTGHYARIVQHSNGARELHRAVDPAKDQSYVLGVLDAEQLARALFPLGDSLKTDVRAEADRRGLAVADKPDSHDICFIADGDTRRFLAERLGTETGPIVDTTGAVVGSHSGAYGFTIGQRKGLRIGDPAGDGRPRYVLDISPVTNTVTVGTTEELAVTEVSGSHPRWCGPVDAEEFECLVQMRAHGEPVPAAVRYDVEQGVVTAQLSSPARGIAPGQTAVLYDGTRVIGSATISATRRATEQAGTRAGH
ncbi:tRNA 2-thiouridine(34) synthase MnmA [Actinocrinis puniceicyclus]|uniref:tRNA-specific 2-thiouridylase MnmA n=1 Tax=Actinocrinis puniceicyclus TaxID=977794 RepID=A0A8J8B9G3_9ACTN|nr:tRNA 2-thiouridine(34) synthase MnmA [Actinocrinis puniceicyclus]MBS2961807.1 tRNA 2-thiouridine(34) synthase MnmA [Actinocrinis puniceicyclus]